MRDAQVEIVSRGEALEATTSTRTGRVREFVDAINMMGDQSAGKLPMPDDHELKAFEIDLNSAARSLGKRLDIIRGTTANPYLYFQVRLQEDSWGAQLIRRVLGVRRVFTVSTLLFGGASVLLAFAASVPIWISRVTDGAVIPVESSTMIGLVALLIATLGLVGGLTYIRLRDEVHESVRSAIDDPVQAAQALSESYASFRVYSKLSHHNAPRKADQLDPDFHTELLNAIARARYALTICRRHLNEPEFDDVRTTAINHLAYHQATMHFHRPEEERKREALSLVDELKKVAGDDWQFWDTIVWVMLRCHGKDTNDYTVARNMAVNLLERGDIPQPHKELLERKYGPILADD